MKKTFTRIANQAEKTAVSSDVREIDEYSVFKIRAPL